MNVLFILYHIDLIILNLLILINFLNLYNINNNIYVIDVSDY